MDNVKDAFTGGLSDIFGFVKKIFELLGDVVTFLGDILTSIKDGFIELAKSIVDKLSDFMSNVANGFLNVIQNIISIPQKIIDLLLELLKYLFVPEYNPIEEIKAKLNEKFTFATQMALLTKELFKDFDSNSSAPVFSFTYKGTEYEIINFEIFEPYRVVIHSIIIAIAWTYFVLWLFKHSPRIVKGGG